MAVLLVAGLLKAADLPGFLDALRTWQFVPKASIPAFALGLPAIELGVAFAWFIGLGRRMMAWCAVFLLGIFTLAYTVHVVFAEPLDCGCLGLLKLYDQGQNRIEILLGRNLLLIFLLLAGILMDRREGDNNAVRVGAKLLRVET